MPLDPLSGGGLPPEFAQMIARELVSLAADAKILQSRLMTGDVVQAIVLPSNGMTDLLDIGGLRVAAELPPALLPGQTITVEVTGFTGDRINLHVLPSADARQTPAPRRAGLSLPAQRASTGLPTQASRPSLAVPAALRSIEARLATAQATIVPAEPPNPAASGAVRRAVTSAANGAGAPGFSVALRPFIALRPATAPGSTEPAVTVPRGPALYSEPGTLLRALNLTATPSNIAAVRLALEAPAMLPQALATLERALFAASDARLTGLATLVAFLSRIEPGSPVLATQIAAFVDHVLTGREVKLVRLFDAHAQASAVSAPAKETTAASAGRLPPAQATSVAAERVVLRQAALDYDLKTQLSVVQTRVAGGAATPENRELSAAVDRAVIALTTLQAAAGSTLAAHPEGIAFALPISLPGGFARAQVRIDRDLPRGANVALDGDNFHIGFVLDTQHLGTVAVDLVTVGRCVTLSVQTEAIAAQQIFGAALNRLTHRLEALHYRVIKADAAVAPRGAALSEPEPRAHPPAPDATHMVDMDA